MTISVSPLFEKGKIYHLTVLFVNKAGQYVNARNDDGAVFKIEVPVSPLHGIAWLKDKIIDFVCAEVTDRGPEFSLAEKYFAAAPKFVKGSNVGLREGLKIEFKRSLIYSPTSHQPDADQPFEIAKEIAAFMNTDGGDLYMGVDDKGYVTGIEGDYPVLGQASLMMDKKSDDDWTYQANFDSYTRKLTNAVQAYLGSAAASLMDEFVPMVDEVSGLTYLKIHVRPSNDVIYLSRDEFVVYRVGSTVVFLKGRERDQYIRWRFILRGEKSAASAVENYKKTIEELKEQLAQSKRVIADGLVNENVVSISGMKYRVEKDTCLPLDEKFLVALDKPSGLAYKVGEVGHKLWQCTPKKTWQSLYEQLLKLCAELDPEKFAALPDNPEFEPKRHCAKTKPNFVRRQDRIRLPSGSCYLGKDSDIRANLQCASKAAFLSPTGLPRRLMAHFGIEVKDIRIWNGK